MIMVSKDYQSKKHCKDRSPTQQWTVYWEYCSFTAGLKIKSTQLWKTQDKPNFKKYKEHTHVKTH